MRITIVENLKELGYRVLTAHDAASALNVIESGVQIDLLFTDVVMPSALKSPELARKAKERLPGIAVLFTSGYTKNAIVHGGHLDQGVELISKPYSREDLARNYGMCSPETGVLGSSWTPQSKLEIELEEWRMSKQRKHGMSGERMSSSNRDSFRSEKSVWER